MNPKDRMTKLRAGMIRSRLLKGVPRDSHVHDIVTNMTDLELIKREEQHTRDKIDLLKTTAACKDKDGASTL